MPSKMQRVQVLVVLPAPGPIVDKCLIVYRYCETKK